MINIELNGRSITAKENDYILAVAKANNVHIPVLCFMKLHDERTINDPGSCRVCMVEVEGFKNLVPACSTKVFEGMKIKTHTPKVIKYRRTVVELILSNHPKECLTCERNGDCELQSLAADLKICEIPYEGERTNFEIDNTSFSIVRDMEKCVYCRRCETMCNEVQKIGVLSGINRGFNSVVAPAFNLPIAETNCTFCGQCVSVCPTASLSETHFIPEVWNALADKSKVVVVQVAPAIRVSLGEMFGYDPGTDVCKKMVSSLKELGFDYVFDTNFGADVTIIEEAHEFVDRYNNGKKLPILTSCCPGWIMMFENDYPDMLDIPSTVKSPHQLFGTITKTYFAEKNNINPDDIIMVSIMPCLAKKYEANRPELTYHGNKDVDFVLSTRELGAMIKEAGINFNSLADTDFDNPLGYSTGAGDIFGASGGVMEAAVRTAYEYITNDSDLLIEFESVRGYKGIKESSININGDEIKVAVANGLGNARTLLDSIRNGEKEYHFIEIMACPGGCIGGGGQPYIKGDSSILKRRIDGIYNIDKLKEIRKSNENPYVKKLYQEYLGEPGGKKAHEMLHTKFSPKKNEHIKTSGQIILEAKQK